MERIQKEQASRCASCANHIAQGKSAGFPAQTEMATRIHSSPLMVAQGKLLQGMFGDRVQLQAEEGEPLQGKFTAQREEMPEEEEPLQGKFVVAQREGLEEEELLQGKFATAQLEGIEEEEPLQGRFASESTVQREPEPVRPNTTGLPDDLKAGVESLSGMSLDHVNVHYNSPQPAQLNALAYAQGGDIHVAPGQERHLPHEAWHVVQQGQGRVQPTRQMKPSPETATSAQAGVGQANSFVNSVTPLVPSLLDDQLRFDPLDVLMATPPQTIKSWIQISLEDPVSIIPEGPTISQGHPSGPENIPQSSPMPIDPFMERLTGQMYKLKIEPQDGVKNAIGGIQLAGGGWEMTAAGIALANCGDTLGAGCIVAGLLLLHGLDTASSGVMTLASDQVSLTYTNRLGQKGASLLTDDPNKQKWAGAGFDMTVGMALSCGTNALVDVPANGPLVHLTSPARAKALSTPNAIFKGTRGIYAGPATNAEARGLGVMLRTGMWPFRKYVPVAIPPNAIGNFVRPLPIGPFSTWQFLTGQANTGAGLLNMTTGMFRSTGALIRPAAAFATESAFTTGFPAFIPNSPLLNSMHENGGE